VEEPQDAQLLQIQDFHSQNGERSSALSQALRDYAALATSLETRIAEEDAEFDMKLVDEAAQLAITLGESGGTAAPPQSKEARDATLERNQLLHLLTNQCHRPGSARDAAVAAGRTRAHPSRQSAGARHAARHALAAGSSPTRV